MLELRRQVIGSRTLHVVVTERADGDQRPDRDSSIGGSGSGANAARVNLQRTLTGHVWSMAAEEHGVAVVDVDAEGARTGCDPHATVPMLPPGDVLVTTQADRALSVWAGDCAPLVLCGANGTLVAAHAGWRGLAEGVIDVAVDELAKRDDHSVAAVLGPCIHAECYEFGVVDLAAVAGGVGADVDRIARSTADGRTRLDVPAAVAAALARRGIGLDVVGPCTSCDERWFSHRARRDDGRHAVVAWTTATTGTTAG